MPSSSNYFTMQVALQPPTSQNVRAVYSSINRGLSGSLSATSNRLVTQTNRSFVELNKTLAAGAEVTNRFGKETGITIRRFAAYSIAASQVRLLVDTLKRGIGDAIKFQREFVKIQQISGGTVGEIASVRKEISKLAIQFGVSSDELNKASKTLLQSGLSIEKVRSTLEAFAKIQLSPTFDGVEEALEGSIALMSQFGIDAKELEKRLGQIALVSAKYAIESEDLVKAIQKAGGVFSVTGGEFEDLIALITAVRATTRESADTIATGFRTIFGRLQRNSTIDFLKRFNITLRDSQNQYVGNFEAVRRLSAALRELPETDPRFSAIVEEIGGIRQLSRVIPLIKQFSVAEKVRQTALSSGNRLTDEALTAQQALSVEFQRTREVFQDFTRDLIEGDGLRTLIKSLNSLLQIATKVAKAVEPLITPLLILGGVSLASRIPSFGRSVLTGAFNPLRRTPLERLNSGGLVPSVLTPGEIVFGPRDVAEIGVNTLKRMNRFATGGIVPGVGNTDSVRADLVPGSFVLRKSAAKAFLESKKPSRFATGGLVGMQRGGLLARDSGSLTVGVGIVGLLAVLPTITEAISKLGDFGEGLDKLIGILIGTVGGFFLLKRSLEGIGAAGRTNTINQETAKLEVASKTLDSLEATTKAMSDQLAANIDALTKFEKSILENAKVAEESISKRRVEAQAVRSENARAAKASISSLKEQRATKQSDLDTLRTSIAVNADPKNKTKFTNEQLLASDEDFEDSISGLDAVSQNRLRLGRKGAQFRRRSVTQEEIIKGERSGRLQQEQKDLIREAQNAQPDLASLRDKLERDKVELESVTETLKLEQEAREELANIPKSKRTESQQKEFVNSGRRISNLRKKQETLQNSVSGRQVRFDRANNLDNILTDEQKTQLQELKDSEARAKIQEAQYEDEKKRDAALKQLAARRRKAGKDISRARNAYLKSLTSQETSEQRNIDKLDAKIAQEEEKFARQLNKDNQRVQNASVGTAGDRAALARAEALRKAKAGEQPTNVLEEGIAEELSKRKGDVTASQQELIDVNERENQLKDEIASARDKIKSEEEQIKQNSKAAKAIAFLGAGALAAGQVLDSISDFFLERGDTKTAIATATTGGIINQGAIGAGIGASIAGPIGAAIGGVAGALKGGLESFFGSSQKAQAKATTENITKINKSLELFNNQITTVSKLNFSEEILNNFRKVATKSVFNTKDLTQFNALREELTSSGVLEGLKDVFSAKVADAGNIENLDAATKVLLTRFLLLSNTTKESFEKSVENTQLLQRVNSELNTTSTLIVKLNSILEDFGDNLKDSDGEFKNLVSIFSGSSQLSFRQNRLSRLDSDPEIFRQQVGLASNVLGTDVLNNFAISLNSAARELPNIFSKLLENEALSGDNVETFLTDEIKKLNLGEELSTLLRARIVAQFKDNDPYEFIKALRLDSIGEVDKILNGLDKNIQPLVKALDLANEALGNFNDRLSEASRIQIDAFKRLADIPLQQLENEKQLNQLFNRPNNFNEDRINQVRGASLRAILPENINPENLIDALFKAIGDVNDTDKLIDQSKDVNQRKELISQRDKELNLIQRINIALENFGDAAKNNALLIDRVNQLQENRLKKRGVVEGFVFGGLDEKQSSLRRLAAAQRVTDTGFDINSILDSDKGSVLELAKEFSQVQLGVFGGKTGEQFIQEILKGAGAGLPDDLKKDLTTILTGGDEEKRLLAQIEANTKLAISIQQQLANQGIQQSELLRNLTEKGIVNAFDGLQQNVGNVLNNAQNAQENNRQNLLKNALEATKFFGQAGVKGIGTQNLAQLSQIPQQLRQFQTIDEQARKLTALGLAKTDQDGNIVLRNKPEDIVKNIGLEDRLSLGFGVDPTAILEQTKNVLKQRQELFGKVGSFADDLLRDKNFIENFQKSVKALEEINKAGLLGNKGFNEAGIKALNAVQDTLKKTQEVFQNAPKIPEQVEHKLGGKINVDITGLGNVSNDMAKHIEKIVQDTVAESLRKALPDISIPALS